jgi:hypothetical protein
MEVSLKVSILVPREDGVKMRIKLIPRNGLGNRLQAITSAIVLSKDIGADVRILWSEETQLPLKAGEVFSSSTLSKLFEECTEPQIRLLLNEIPEFLTTSEETGQIFLRGNRLGEQKFMKRISELIRSNANYKQITIVAGGQFELNRKRKLTRKRLEFQERRHVAYENLIFSQAINDDAETMLSSLTMPYIALHLRGTDRANQSISDRLLVRECLRLNKKVKTGSFLIVGDSADRIAIVRRLFESSSISPQLSPVKELTRTSSTGSRMAILDWILLKNAAVIVASSTSTFAVEAAVAGGLYEKSVFLKPNLAKRARIYLLEKLALFRKFGVNPF